MNNLDLLIPTEPTPPDNWQWATVTQASPLRVRLDGDATPLLITPECLFYGPVVGQRVWVQMYNRRVIVHAPSGGVTPYVPKINVIQRNTYDVNPNNSGVPNGGSYTIYGGVSTAIPTGAQAAQISWQCDALSDTNAAGYWYVYVNNSPGGWFLVAQHRVHNYSNPSSNLASHMTVTVDMDELGTDPNLTTMVILTADSGGGWLYPRPGALQLSWLKVS